MLLEKQRQEIVDACRYMLEKNLVVETAGNVSIREGDYVAISPSGVDYLTMTAADVVVTDLSGNIIDGDLKPSSELPLHLSVYKVSNAKAITHNHAVSSTALGLVVDEIPASHYYCMMFGGPIRVAPYALFGSDELAEGVAAALADRTAALMKNHGAITTGQSLQKALSMLSILEYVCEIQLKAMATGQPVALLDEVQLALAGEAMKDYGKRPARSNQ